MVAAAGGSDGSRRRSAAALFLAGLCFRPQLVAVTPLLPAIERSLHVRHAVSGLLVTVPLVCMGLFAPVGRALGSRLHTRPAVAWTIALMTTAGVARAFAPGIGAIVLLTLPIGIAIAFSGVLLPLAAKERFPHTPAFGIGMFATGLILSSAVAALLAVPLAHAWGLGWRGSLAVLALATGVCLPLWVALAGRPERKVAAGPGTQPLVGFWRNQTIYAITLLFTLLAVSFYGLSAWLADAYVERGWSQESAGALVGVLFLAMIPGGQIVAWLGDRVGTRRQHLLLTSSVFAAAILGFVAVPSLGWLLAAVGGFAEGALFSLALTLPLDVAEQPSDVARVSSFMLGIGYTLGGIGPTALGAIRDASGTFQTGLWIVFALAAAITVVAASLSAGRLGRLVPEARADRSRASRRDAAQTSVASTCPEDTGARTPAV